MTPGLHGVLQNFTGGRAHKGMIVTHEDIALHLGIDADDVRQIKKDIGIPERGKMSHNNIQAIFSYAEKVKGLKKRKPKSKTVVGHIDEIEDVKGLSDNTLVSVTIGELKALVRRLKEDCAAKRVHTQLLYDELKNEMKEEA